MHIYDLTVAIKLKRAQSNRESGDCLIQIQFYNIQSRKSIISYHSVTTNTGLHNGLHKTFRPFTDLRPTTIRVVVFD